MPFYCIGAQHIICLVHILQIHIFKSLILWNFLTNTQYRFEKDRTQIHTACLGSFPFPVTRLKLRTASFNTAYLLAIFFVKLQRLKPLQNKKGQKNLRYPTKKQSFSLEKDCFLSGTSSFLALLILKRL